MANAAVAAKADVRVVATAIAVTGAVVSAVVSAPSPKRPSATVNARLNVRRPRPAPKVAVVDAVTVRRTAARPRPVPSCRPVVARRDRLPQRLQRIVHPDRPVDALEIVQTPEVAPEVVDDAIKIRVLQDILRHVDLRDLADDFEIGRAHV